MMSSPTDAAGTPNDIGTASPGASAQNAVLLDQVFRDGRYEFSGNQDIDAVLIGSKWTPSTLTYGFPTGGDLYAGTGYGPGAEPDFQVPFNGKQQAAARVALGLVASYTNLTFAEVAATVQDRPNLRLSQTGSPVTGTATGMFPSNVRPSTGDIWFGLEGGPFYDTPGKGNWGDATMMHEIGHALGLKHGQDDYTKFPLDKFIDPSSDGSPRFGSAALPSEHNGQDWSIMTYQRAPAIPVYADVSDLVSESQTYMQNDIAALQYLYGANFTSHGNDTIYRWDQTTGEMSIDGVGQGAPVNNRIRMTVWDGNGNDTYDLANYTTNLRVDLRPGAFSTFDSDQIARETDIIGQVSYSTGNVANALLYQNDTRSLIENAIGGVGSDVIHGNAADNHLVGGGGADVLTGDDGDDLLEGGDANDSLFGGSGRDRLDGGDGNDKLFGGDDADWLDGGTGDDSLWGGAGTDTLLGGDGSDQLKGDDGDDAIDGGTGNDSLMGEAGNDSLFGGEGTDLILGDAGDDAIDGGTGDDILMGGAGNDSLFGGEGTDQISGDAGNDSIDGGDGNDLADGGIDNDILAGGTGLDTLFGSGGDDIVSGQLGDDFIGVGAGNDFGSGGDGNDEVHGEDGNDLLFGDEGNDGVYGEAGDDIVYGGTGNDVLTGDGGNDRLRGESGDDRLSGGDDNDDLAGGVGNDILAGDAGSDLLFGNAGGDLLSGGAGADIFGFGRGDGRDRILDFVTGGPEADVIAFNGGVFASFTAVQEASRQDGADLVIAYGASDAVTLQGTRFEALTAANFAFV